MWGNALTSSSAIHLGHKLDPGVLDSLADFVCGDNADKFPAYRSSSNLTRFFQGIGINANHDGSTRKWWVTEILKQLRPSELEKVILRLVDLREYKGSMTSLKLAAQSMNEILSMENLAIGFEGVQSILKRAAPINIDEAEMLKPNELKDEAEFLSAQFSDSIILAELDFDAIITAYHQNRVDEAQACPKDNVPLGTIFLLGSTLEGMLLATALKDPKKYMSSKSAPKDKTGKIKQIHNWNLSELIDVAYNVNDIGLDVKKFSHELRDFRNYIHPYQQMSQSFNPDQHTVDICWQVFKAAFHHLKSSGELS